MNAFVEEAKRRQRAYEARQLRYKRGTLSLLGWDRISTRLQEIREDCSDVHWALDEDESETLIAALSGDEDEAYEFKIAFADLEATADRLDEQLSELSYYSDDFEREFDDCTVALIGNQYRVEGYDTFEEDYYSLTAYEAKLATTEAGKRLMRSTKAEIISRVGQCLGILLAFYDVEQQYGALSAAMHILKGNNATILKTVKGIEDAYEDLFAENSRDAEREFDRMAENLPERCWIE